MIFIGSFELVDCTEVSWCSEKRDIRYISDGLSNLDVPVDNQGKWLGVASESWLRCSFLPQLVKAALAPLDRREADDFFWRGILFSASASASPIFIFISISIKPHITLENLLIYLVKYIRCSLSSSQMPGSASAYPPTPSKSFK